MSREIDMICKAKRTNNGEWVEGFYFCMVHDDGRHIHHFIIPIGADLNLGTPIEKIQVEIDIDTLCRPTGLTDKNGNKIWENDIFKHYNRITCGDEEAYVLGEVFWDEERCRFTNKDWQRNSIYVLNQECIYEVIGNCFDNADLLEG